MEQKFIFKKYFRVKGRDHFILSSRFQMNENVSSSKLLWRLSCAQLIIFLLYGCAMYSLRIFLPGERSAVWQAVTEFCYVSVCTLCALNFQSFWKKYFQVWDTWHVSLAFCPSMTQKNPTWIKSWQNSNFPSF